MLDVSTYGGGVDVLFNISSNITLRDAHMFTGADQTRK
jgi:hypothetical protein